MSRTRTLLLAGIASVGLASVAFSQTMHEETVQLGPNAVEHIFFSGSVAPQVMISQNAPGARTDSAMLAEMVQRQAVMAAQAQQMLQQAAAMLSAPMAMPEMPMLNAASSAAACVTSMSFTQIGAEQPKVTEYRSVGCGGGAPAIPLRPTELRPVYAPSVPAPKLIQARLVPQDETPSG